MKKLIEENTSSSLFTNLVWELRLTPTPAIGAHLSSVCWSKELHLFCAVSETGLIMTSPDSVTWTLRDTSGPLNLGYTSVCWAPELGLFCAVSYSNVENQVVTSPDGIEWTAHRSTEPCSWISVCWSPGLKMFVAVANTGNNRIMHSYNGSDWDVSSDQSIDYGAVCWSEELGIFCTIGGDGGIATSSDGINWDYRPYVGPTNTLWSICWSPELHLFCVVAYAGTNRIMTSPDGIEWTFQTTAPDQAWVNVSWSPLLERFCAVAQDGLNSIATSLDGKKWVTQAAPINTEWTSICWSPELDIFCSVSHSGDIMTSVSQSYDFTTKKYVDDAVETIGAGGLKIDSQFFNYLITRNLAWKRTNNGGGITDSLSVCWSPKLRLFCKIVDSDPVIYTSSNGTTWTLHETESYIPKAVCWGQDKFCVMDDNGFSTTSTDGSTWITHEAISPYTSGFTSMCYAPSFNKFCATRIGPNGGSLFISDDGETWIPKNVTNHYWNSVCWSEGLDRLVAVAINSSLTDGKRSMISDDGGETWETSNQLISRNFSSVCWSEELELFCAVCNDNVTDGIFVSSTGEIWNNVGSVPPATWSSVCWSQEFKMFCAVSEANVENRVIISLDGSHWAVCSDIEGYFWSSICWSPELCKFCVVGRDDVSLVSLSPFRQ